MTWVMTSCLPAGCWTTWLGRISDMCLSRGSFSGVRTCSSHGPDPVTGHIAVSFRQSLGIPGLFLWDGPASLDQAGQYLKLCPVARLIPGAWRQKRTRPLAALKSNFQQPKIFRIAVYQCPAMVPSYGVPRSCRVRCVLLGSATEPPLPTHVPFHSL